jgi:xanthine dehydrogenase accessory factor
MRDTTHVMPRTAPPDEALRAALAALDRGQRAVVATVIARHGSTPSTPGQKLALTAGLVAVGTVGGGAVERVVLGAMAAMLDARAPAPRVETFRLGPSLGMSCGGHVEILVEPLEPPLYAFVVGAGHVGAFLAPLLASLGFRVTLSDGREAAADPARLAPPPQGGAGERAAVRVVHADHDDPELLAGFAGEPRDAVVLVMTHDHQLDQDAIEWAVRKGFGYVGGVGSRAKAVKTRARLEAKGFEAAAIERVRMPVGVDCGARTPAEIGVSIAAELVGWRAARQRAAAGEAAREARDVPPVEDGTPRAED